MSLTGIQIIGFVVGMIYQPLEYKRRDMGRRDFTDIQRATGRNHNELVIDEEPEDEEED